MQMAGRGPAPMGRFGGMPHMPYGGVQQPPAAEAFFPFLQCERKLPELCKRHPRIYYSQDLTQEVCHWVNNNDALEVPLDIVTNFNLKTDKTVVLPADFDKKEEPKEDDEVKDTYSARVMLLSPLKPDDSKRHKMQKVRFATPPDFRSQDNCWIPCFLPTCVFANRQG